MAARKVRGVGLSHFEVIAGGILLVLYLLVLPFIRAGLFRAVEHLFGTSISPQTENVIYYYVLFAVTLVIFYGFIGRSTGYFFGNFVETLYAVGVGLVLFYGLNEVLFRLSRALFGHQLNLNDYPISAQIHDAPKAPVLILMIIAPCIEEVLFRGYIFGGLKGHGALAAYGASCALFAFLHVWQFLGEGCFSLSGVILLVQYLAPAAVLACVYDRSGNLWGPLLVHVIVNGMYVWWGA